MRRDLIIGILLSIAFHGGAAWISEELSKRPTKKHMVQEEAPTIQLMEMPKLEPDEPPETADTSDAEAAPVEFAPPMQTDVPQIVQLDSFVQQVQPPPPENLKPAVGVISIPQNRPTGLGKGIQVFNINQLDQIPQIRATVPPQYPFEMRRAGITGEVLVEFIVDTNGDVRNPFAVRSTQREFETAAVQAVAKWKFRPGKKGGRVVNTRMQQPISFSLNED
ncbi:energy transducer TonB [Opitutus terrae]|uniref:TonB family protein n=1 Tax=Opitutus terrae (strain DSM 11246 / JCM 15787 / PB90-1) TaxID=452637 RepID=B1ZQL7_OPITP|nr:energy transducer TonB [Opitutus terrae]ACB75626.1 TonB family protein [Opitutus terrae PB90-1]